MFIFAHILLNLNKNFVTLFDLQDGKFAYVVKVRGRGAFRKRIMEMGFTPGRKVKKIKSAPLGDPVEYRLMEYSVSLRNADAKFIEIISEKEFFLNQSGHFFPESTSRIASRVKEKSHQINIALVGNPNCGKSTIFNHASHTKAKVGNYGGVTIESKVAHFQYKGHNFRFVDLPGTYSISSYSPEELYVRNFIAESLPDIVLNVVDASNIERNLYLTTQLIDMDQKMVVALNMYDEMQKKGHMLNHQYLGKLLGIPFIPTIGTKGKGLDLLFDTVLDTYYDRDPNVRPVNIKYQRQVESAVKNISHYLLQFSEKELLNRYSPRFLALRLLEKDDEVIHLIRKRISNPEKLFELLRKERSIIEKDFADDIESVITDMKYGFIAGALKETHVPAKETQKLKSDHLDALLTHKFFGIPFFAFFMWIAFYTTFNLGQYPVSWIENGFTYLANHLHQVMNNGMLKDLLVDGVIGGVGSVLVFLPNIILLYFFISIMEDTGYMARAVFIMDKSMHKIGLHGKSFIPLLMGFGCNVPAIMSARIIENRRDRILTMMINPFMSCSARLPLYILLISAFFLKYQALVLFAIYTFGILVAILSAFIYNKLFPKKQDIPFVMELPPYRMPTLRSSLKNMWNNTKEYLKKITGVILMASVIIWLLSYFPKNPDIQNAYDGAKKSIERYYDRILQKDQFLSEKEYSALIHQKEESIKLVEYQKHKFHLEHSFIGRAGKFMTPVMEPLGFNWKMTVGLITGVVAKEVIVGTLGILTATDEGENLALGMKNTLFPKQTKLTNHYQKVAISYMVFVLLYVPCIGVLIVLRKETHSMKYPIFMVLYTTAIAWLLSFLVFKIFGYFL